MIAYSLILPLLVGWAQPIPLQGEQQPPQKAPKPGSRKADRHFLVDLPEGFVQYARVPDDGVLSRVCIGKDDLAVLYFKGEPNQGDLFLTRSSDECATFTPSLRLNPAPATVKGWEENHTGSMALDPEGRANVAWITAGESSSISFVRIAREGNPEPVVDLGSPPGLCGTTAVAIDAEGRIYLAYAASRTPTGSQEDALARVWLRQSTDGKTFSEPLAIDRDKDGFSELCGIAAHVDEVMGTVFVIYRCGAPMKPGEPGMSRGVRILASENKGQSFDSNIADTWRQQKDPRSSAGLSQEKNTTLVTWESGGKVCWSLIRRNLNKTDLPIAPKDEGQVYRRTQAAGAAGGDEILLAWLERTRGDPSVPATIGWQVWLREGRLALGTGHAPEPPRSCGPSVFPRKAGGFTILY